MAWFESHQSLARHPKTHRLMARLGTSRAATIGHMNLFWWWCLDYAPDGDLAAFSTAEIAIAAEWDGEPDAFVDALVAAGFVDRDDYQCIVHDWDEYGGKLLKRKEVNRNRMRESRATHDDAQITANNNRASHVQRTTDARATHVQDDAANVQSQSREEERREENNTPQTPKGDDSRPKLESIDGGKKPPSALERRFDIFWDAYPNKVGKAACRKWWDRNKPDDALLGVMVTAIERQRGWDKWQRDNGRYIPNPHTWLNEGRWEDQPEQGAPAPVSTDDAKAEKYRKRIAYLERGEWENVTDRETFKGESGERERQRQLAFFRNQLAELERKAGAA